MFCKYCGAKIDDDALFCSKCGEKTKAVFNDVKSEEMSTNDKAEYDSQKENTSVPGRVEKHKKLVKIIVCSILALAITVSAIIPLVVHRNNKLIDEQLNILKDSDTYFIDGIEKNGDDYTVIFSNRLDWSFLEGKKVNYWIGIIESGAVVEMTEDDEVNDMYLSDYGYISPDEQDENESTIFYSLYAGNTENINTITKERTYHFASNGENIQLEENRVYDFFISLDEGQYQYSSYYRYTNGKFAKVTAADLKYEDACFAWKENKLYIASFGGYYNDDETKPAIGLSDETYGTRD